MLAYLARYTHRVAIANSRLIALRDGAVTFRWKDYRIKGRDRQKTMTLPVSEFIRRFLIHVLPSGFHRIRHYGLLASGARARNIAQVRQLLTPAAQSNPNDAADDPGEADPPNPYPCPCCGGRMIVIETFGRAGPSPQPDEDQHLMIEHPAAYRATKPLFLSADVSPAWSEFVRARYPIPKSAPTTGQNGFWQRP